VKPRQPTLQQLAGALIALSITAGISTLAVRATSGGSLTVRLLEGTTLLLAAVAYLFYVLAHHSQLGQVVSRLILVTAFALWASRTARPRHLRCGAAQRPHHPALRRRPRHPALTCTMKTQRRGNGRPMSGQAYWVQGPLRADTVITS
jgi:hypothetical protein